MKREIIDAVAAAGFDVYMRKTSDTWLIFTDGQRLGYLKDDGCLSTVHIPNVTSGTGFQIERHADMRTLLTRENLERAFAHCPHWHRRVAGSVRKYRDIEHYRASSTFNADYQLVAARVGA